MKKIFLYTIIVCSILIACNNSSENYNNAYKNNVPQQKTGFNNAQKQEEQDNYQTADSTGTGNNQPPINDNTVVNNNYTKYLIKTAYISVEVKDYKQYNSYLANLLQQYKAYITAEEETNNNYTLENAYTIRVPVEKFDALMNRLSTKQDIVTEKRITTEDVSAEVIDTKARLENKKAVRQQYLNLLSKAKNMQEVIEIQREINSITEEAEAAAARIKYLSNQAAYSTVYLKIVFYHNSTDRPTVTPTFTDKLIAAFKEGAKGIVNFFLFLINIWPIVLLGFAVMYIIKRKKIFTRKQ
jgi:hypothetical protein